MADDVVITGMGIVSPIGSGEDAFWSSLCSGKSAAAPVDSFSTSELPRQIACQVRDTLDAPKDLGRASRLAISAARQLASTADIDFQDLSADRTATIIGTTMGETQFIEDRIGTPDERWLSGDHIAQIMRGRPGSISASVRADLGLSGPSYDLYGACAAGNMAITAARRRILADECDIAIVGGADGFSRLAFIGFMRARIMASRLCRPFDTDREGLLVGEGAVLFLIERESHARARGATIRAKIAGAAVTCEDYHPTRPHPDGDGLTRATIQAIQDAGVENKDVDYVCAHGTGTPQNDAIEVKVMENCFPDGVAFSSIKALTGHPMGAAAATEIACCILSLENNTLIPTWHLDNVLQPCSLDAVQGGLRQTPVRCVINNSAGFGGYNSSVVLTAA